MDADSAAPDAARTADVMPGMDTFDASTPMCRGDIEVLQRLIFVPRCGTANCHASLRPSANLDLSSPNVSDRLSRINAEVCAGGQLVVPGNPAASVLFNKISEPMPMCGRRMPLGMAPLSTAEINCFRDWIASLPLHDAGTTDVGMDVADAALDARGDVPSDVSTCPMGQTSCNGRCVDLQTSSGNCGACGTACSAATSCVAGRCACPMGQTECNGMCVGLASDDRNCGACGTACVAAQRCVGGVCSCAMELSLCGVQCLDTQTDVANCGRCGNQCAAMMVCTLGVCRMGACPARTINCDGSCVDLSNNNMNCGACGQVCPAAQSCAAGVCSCPANTTFCNGMCVNLLTDSLHCGGCGVRCAAGMSCTAGVCACPAGLRACGGVCVNINSDSSHCGACGNSCPAGAGCNAGSCVCAVGATICNGVCVNTDSDASNCGACGTVCAGGRQCSGGNCVCPIGTVNCGGTCAELSSDADNCGRCGMVCAAGQGCNVGVCASCGQPVSFAREVQPILTASCTTGCHSAPFPSSGLNLEMGASYLAAVNVRSRECGDGRMIVRPRGPASSHLVNKIEGVAMCAGNRMPLGGPPLLANEINLIRRWVCQGAFNN